MRSGIGAVVRSACAMPHPTHPTHHVVAMHPLDVSIALGPVEHVQVDVVRVEVLQGRLDGVRGGHESQLCGPHLALQEQLVAFGERFVGLRGLQHL